MQTIQNWIWLISVCGCESCSFEMVILGATCEHCYWIVIGLLSIEAFSWHLFWIVNFCIIYFHNYRFDVRNVCVHCFWHIVNWLCQNWYNVAAAVAVFVIGFIRSRALFSCAPISISLVFECTNGAFDWQICTVSMHWPIWPFARIHIRFNSSTVRWIHASFDAYYRFYPILPCTQHLSFNSIRNSFASKIVYITIRVRKLCACRNPKVWPKRNAFLCNKSIFNRTN